MKRGGIYQQTLSKGEVSIVLPETIVVTRTWCETNEQDGSLQYVTHLYSGEHCQRIIEDLTLEGDHFEGIIEFLRITGNHSEVRETEPQLERITFTIDHIFDYDDD
jgi:hypothetical protein